MIEGEDFADEPDPLEVRMEQGFWMGQTPITRGMFKRFVEADAYTTEEERAGRGRVFSIHTDRWENLKGVSWRNPGLPVRQ